MFLTDDVMFDAELRDVRCDFRDDSRHFVAQDGWHRDDIVRGEQQVGMTQPRAKGTEQQMRQSRPRPPTLSKRLAHPTRTCDLHERDLRGAWIGRR
jgi:hypothetical protein